MVKTVGCKISDELYQMIRNEISKIGKTNSEFLRMLINNYFKDHKSIGINLVNQLTIPVNQFPGEDEYEIIRKEVDGFLKGFNENMKK